MEILACVAGLTGLGMTGVLPSTWPGPSWSGPNWPGRCCASACRLTCLADVRVLLRILNRCARRVAAHEYGPRVIICSRQRTHDRNEGRDGQLAGACHRCRATRRAVAVPAGFPRLPDCPRR